MCLPIAKVGKAKKNGIINVVTYKNGAIFAFRIGSKKAKSFKHLHNTNS